MDDILENYELVILELLEYLLKDILPRNIIRKLFDDYLAYMKTYRVYPTISEYLANTNIYCRPCLKDFISDTSNNKYLKNIQNMLICYKNLLVM